MGEETRRTSSEPPRWVPVVAILAWVGATTTGGWFFSMLALLSAATFFGEPPGSEDLRRTIGFAAAAVALVTAGPFGVWIVRRTRVWLVTSVIVIALAIAWAVALLVNSF